jgi:dTDP-4-amino-4,6-dideoxygalactose transaminase
MKAVAEKGVQLGRLIEYSMPNHPSYREYRQDQEFPNSLACSRTTINLPMHPGLSDAEVDHIIAVMNSFV